MKNDIKIAFSIPTNTAAGAERVITTLANAFDNYGFKTLLVMYDYDSEFYPVNNSIKQYKLGEMEYRSKTWLDRWTKVIILTFKRYYNLKRLYELERPDVIISFLFPTNIMNIIVAKRLGIPIIVSERSDPNVYPRIKRALVDYLYKKADYVVCQTELIKSRFSNVIKEKTLIIKNPITKEQVGTNTKKNRNKVILHVGRLVLEKNQKLLIKAFFNISALHNDYQLHIYGDGPQKKILEEYAQELGIGNKVYFKGVVPNAIVLNQDASMFVLTSNVEGIPNTLIEAMANGIPSISTNFTSGAALELIENGVNGLIVPTNDEDALTSNMLQIINKPEKAEKIGENAKRIIEVYDVDTIRNRWIELVTSLNKN